jgi:hypothetical protein
MRTYLVALDQSSTFTNAAKGRRVALHWLLRCDPEDWNGRAVSGPIQNISKAGYHGFALRYLSQNRGIASRITYRANLFALKNFRLCLVCHHLDYSRVRETAVSLRDSNHVLVTGLDVAAIHMAVRVEPVVLLHIPKIGRE